MRGASSRPREASPLGQLYLWVGLAAFFVLGGHRVALSLIGDGLLRHPPGAAANVSWASLAMGSAGLVADALTLAIMVAIPIALALLLMELTMGAIARSGAALAVDGMLLPARAALGLGFALLGAAVLVGELPVIFETSLRAFRGMLGGGP
jgi:type III secretory pathway component EscT